MSKVYALDSKRSINEWAWRRFDVSSDEQGMYTIGWIVNGTYRDIPMLEKGLHERIQLTTRGGFLRLV